MATLISVQPAWALTFTVNSTADAVDINVGNGICRTSANTCTLRAAIQEANASLPADTIQVPAGIYSIGIAPSGSNDDDTGDFDIVSPLTIIGAGAGTVVDGGAPPAGAPAEQRGLDRLLEIHDTAGNVTASNLTLREGYDIEQGGAILNQSPGFVRLQNVSVLDSYAGVAGGGIANDGTGKVTIGGSTIKGNKTGGSGGGIASDHEVELTLTDISLTDNAADGDGGGSVSGSKTKLTITRGTVSGNTAGGDGGGVYASTMRPTAVKDVVFTGNAAGDELAGGGGGGGLYIDGTGSSTVTGSSFIENTAVGEGGGLSLHALGPATVTDSVVRGNKSEAGGGGVESAGMRVTLTRLSVTGNTSATDGGGIESQGSGLLSIVDTTVSQNTAHTGGGFANVADGGLQITGSTFWDNRAKEFGGGVANLADAASLIENTSISGNVAQVSGGGIYSDADAGLRVVNVTVNRNIAPRGSGIGDESGGSVNFPVTPSTAVILRNTIVAGNLYSAECSFAVGSEGGNLDSADSCYFRGSRDRTNAGDPKIDAIADNGGPTMTHALQDGSFALDGGVFPCGEIDQRGVTRPKNTGCDIGALEHEGPFPAPDTIAPDTLVTSGPTFAAERAKFTFAGTDNSTPVNELLFECRVLTNDPTDPAAAGPHRTTRPGVPVRRLPDPVRAARHRTGPEHARGAGDRPGRQRRPDTGGARLHRRVGSTPPETTFVSTPPNPSVGRTAVFSFPRHRRPDPGVAARIRVPHRQQRPAGLGGVRQSVELLQPHPRPAHRRGPRDRRGRQHRPDTGDVHLDGRHPDRLRRVEHRPGRQCRQLRWTSSARWRTSASVLEDAGMIRWSGARAQDARALVWFVVPPGARPAGCELTAATLRPHG